MFPSVQNSFLGFQHIYHLDPSAGAVEYTDKISAQRYDTCNEWASRQRLENTPTASLQTGLTTSTSSSGAEAVEYTDCISAKV